MSQKQSNFVRVRDFVEGKVVNFNNNKCFIKVRPYNSGRLFMSLIDSEDGYAVCRVTLDIDAIPIMDDMIIVKSYSENEGLYEALLESDIIKKAERKFEVGHEFALVCFLNIP